MRISSIQDTKSCTGSSTRSSASSPDGSLGQFVQWTLPSHPPNPVQIELTMLLFPLSYSHCSPPFKNPRFYWPQIPSAFPALSLVDTPLPSAPFHNPLHDRPAAFSPSSAYIRHLYSCTSIRSCRVVILSLSYQHGYIIVLPFHTATQDLYRGDNKHSSRGH